MTESRTTSSRICIPMCIRGRIGGLIAAWAMALIAIFALGCSQDPFEGRSEEIRNAAPPDRKPIPEKPLSEMALRIDVPDFVTFNEGKEGEVRIQGRVLNPVAGREAEMGKDFVITVENLADFPGASYDENVGVFKWTPPFKYVNENYTRNVTLDLKLSTKGGIVKSRTRQLPAFVSRSEVDPQVVDVLMFSPEPVREGDIREFHVVVRDPESLDKTNMRPRLLVVSASNASASFRNGAHLVRPASVAEPEQDKNDPTLWKFRMAIDTTRRELTANQERFAFGLVAVSRFGRSSAPRNVDFFIRTKVGRPQITWNNALALVTAGERSTFTFTVFDPAGEGRVAGDLGACSDVLPGASCTCPPSTGNRSILTCTIRWKPSKTRAPGWVTFDGEFTNFSQVTGDPTFESISQKIMIQVLPPLDEEPPPAAAVRGAR